MEPDLNQLLIDEAKKDFLLYCQLVIPNYTVTQFHEILGKELMHARETVNNGGKVRLILSVPPRHGKTLTAASLFPSWVLGLDTNTPFIYSTYSGELAEKTGKQTRDIINSEAYQAIFPNKTLQEDTKAKRKWMTKDGGSYYAVGIGGSVTGVGAKYIMLDDPHKDRAEAESQNMRETVYEYYRSTLYSRLEGLGAVIVIMQRWHVDDLVGRLIEDSNKFKAKGEDADEWRVINFPAIAEEDEHYTSPTESTPILFRKKGEALWPDKFSVTTLENIKQTQGTYNFQSQYQQDPIISELQIFKEEMFKYYEPEELLPLQKMAKLKYYTLVDPAISDKKDADETVVLTVAKTKDSPNIYRIREDAGFFTPTQLVDLVFTHNEMFRSELWLETVAYQKSLKYSIEERQRAQGRYFTVNEVKSSNKTERIKGLLPLYEQGVVYHKNNDRDYEKQLIQFPRGKHDDRADCMSFLIQALENTRKWNKAKIYTPNHIRNPFARRW